MLSCHACMRHCLQTIIGRPLQQLHARSIPTPRPVFRSCSRTYTQSHALLKEQRESAYQQDGHITISNSSSELSTTRFERNRQEWLRSRGVRPPSKVKRRPNLETEASMNKHLQYLRDPLKLSEYVRTTLRNDDFETAEKVVHYASKKMQCVVSWNHLVDWQLSKGRMNAAIKIFNDMKKRAQTPDAYTYTIIFRGCAAHKDAKQALEKVLAIYHSMSADNCPIKPNTIHVNAVLKMCAKAGNMDAMFAIADHLPETGLRAPNNLTYTTILNGLRSKVAIIGRSELSTIQQRNEIQRSILTARHIWTDVVKRWRRGDIWIDEELVCAMGRLMLLGSDRDADDILSLIEQTMSIPRQIPAKQHLPPPSINTDELENNEKTPQEYGSSAVSNNIEGESVISFTEPIMPVKPPKGTSPYPSPGRNTLSLLLTALLKQKDHSSAPTSYWSLLTSPPYSVIPDSENYAAYLRTLRITRSSTAAVQLLSRMPKDLMTPGTFRIAISTCFRDKNNVHAFANAGKVLDYMQTALRTPDPKVLEIYLELAITAPVHNSANLASSQTDSPGKPTQEEITRQNRAHGSVISRALHRLGPSINNLRATLSWGNSQSATPVMKGLEREEYTLSVIRLMQRMVSAYDILMERGMVERTDYVALGAQKSKLAAFITRLKAARVKEEEYRTVGLERERRSRRREAVRDSPTDYKSVRAMKQQESAGLRA